MKLSFFHLIFRWFHNGFTCRNLLKIVSLERWVKISKKIITKFFGRKSGVLDQMQNILTSSFTNVDCQQQDIIRFQRYLDNVIFRFILFFVGQTFLQWWSHTSELISSLSYYLRIGILHIRYKGIYLYVHQKP